MCFHNIKNTLFFVEISSKNHIEGIMRGALFGKTDFFSLPSIYGVWHTLVLLSRVFCASASTQ